MTAITELMSSATSSGKLRAFDPRRDLRRVADLVELCFAETLDQEGHSYLRHMRAAANNPGYTRWAGLMLGGAPLPLSGFVWEEDNQIVGNLTLIPYMNLMHRYYLLANVAVHPGYRRRGIARSLTEKAIDYVRQRGAGAAWLHVRAENNVAGELYRSLGFIERARRTTWHNNPETSTDVFVRPATVSGSGIKISPRRSADWPAQQLWLKRLYPSHVTWHLPLRIKTLQPGLRGFLNRVFNDFHLLHWSARRDSRLIGSITWQSSLGYTDPLWLAVDPDGDETAIAPLLAHVLRHCSLRRTLSLDYPSGRAVHEIQSAGFHEHQTLVWMTKNLAE